MRAAANTASASPTEPAKIDTQSNDGIAGTTPVVGTTPDDGFRPTIPQLAAGIRPDPAVSVPSENTTSPTATTTAEPELDPPAMYSGTNGFRHAPNADERVPTRPVANWSRFVLPTHSAPASTSRCTTVADADGT